jgi:hypothetical protein
VKEKQGINKHTSIHTKPAVHNSHNNTNNQINFSKGLLLHKGLASDCQNFRVPSECIKQLLIYQFS